MPQNTSVRGRPPGEHAPSGFVRATPTFAVARAESAGEGSASIAFADLRVRLQAAGLLRKRPDYYVPKILGTLVVFALLAAGIALSEPLWLRALMAVLFAVAVGQVAFLGHDAVHQQVSRNGKRNSVLGLLFFNLLLGASASWWRDDHTRHHAYSNQPGLDPNMEIPGLAFTQQQAHQSQGIGRWLVRQQARLAAVLVSLEAFAAQYLSIRHLLRLPLERSAREFALIGLHAVAYLAIMFWQGLAEGIVVLLVHQLCTGLYLAAVFAPNHKGMPVLEHGTQLDFLHRQTLTSRNVRGGAVTDFLYGGLNYQIEHHLFPSMPRCHLPAAQDVVRAFCAERSVAYHETSAPEAYREIFRHLRAVGRLA